MSETFVRVKHKTFLDNLFSSFVGVGIGLLLFIASFFVLWMNEGKTNWSQVANKSVAVDAAQVNAANNDTFVAATGALVTNGTLSDAQYLRGGSYVKLERRVEMYAWREDERSETRNNTGGSSDTKTTYTYEKEWTQTPEDSDNFEFSHPNPKKQVPDMTMKATDLRIGAFTLNADKLDMYNETKVQLNSDIVVANANQMLSGDYLYINKSVPNNPQIGDLRIQYYAVPNNLGATVFGTQQGSAIVPYMYKGETAFYREMTGDRAQAIADLKTEHTILTWALRLGGFLAMWIGMMLGLGPITAVLNIFPMLGSVSGFVTSAGTFVAALVLSIITIVVSMIVHSLIAMIVLLLLIGGGLFLWGRRNQRSAATESAPAT